MNTANKGAAIERGKLLAKLRRMRKNCQTVPLGMAEAWRTGYQAATDDIAAWVKESATRASKRPGGLGRKPKKITGK